MRRIEEHFAKLAKRGEKALITYITAGHPRREDFVPLLLALEEAGSDILEVGVPFNDPVADGPVIQASSHAALTQGVNLTWILGELGKARAKGLTAPVILMGYCNPFLVFGLSKLALAAKAAGVDGFIIPDLPADHADEWLAAFGEHDLGIAFIAAPTSSQERLELIGQRGSGFVYCVAVTGVTGERSGVSHDVATLVARVRAVTSLPLAVGFGISKPEHVREVTRSADGAIVGSALIRVLEEAESGTAIGAAQRFVESLKRATRS